MSGCSSDEAAAPPAPAAPGVCPNTVKQAAGAKCAQNGQDCPIGYLCTTTPEQAHCVCTAGAFVCTDATGMVVPANRDPQCVAQGMGNDTDCPKTEVVAKGTACATAGLLCYYEGPFCPEGNGIPNRDVCQCKGSPQAFECEPELCHPSSDASDDQAAPIPDATAADASADVKGDVKGDVKTDG